MGIPSVRRWRQSFFLTLLIFCFAGTSARAASVLQALQPIHPGLLTGSETSEALEAESPTFEDYSAWTEKLVQTQTFGPRGLPRSLQGLEPKLLPKYRTLGSF